MFCFNFSVSGNLTGKVLKHIFFFQNPVFTKYSGSVERDVKPPDMSFAKVNRGRGI